MNSHQQAIDITKSLIGQSNLLSIPVYFIKYTGSVNAALLLGQLLYWADKGDDSECFIHKTYDEWEEEICLKKDAVSSARAKLETMGIIETKVKRVEHSNCNSGVVHYKMLMDMFLQDYGSFLKKLKGQELKSGKSHLQAEELPTFKRRNISLSSITETTTETTPERKEVVLPGIEEIKDIIKVVPSGKTTSETQKERIMTAGKVFIQAYKKYTNNDYNLSNGDLKNLDILSEKDLSSAIMFFPLIGVYVDNEKHNDKWPNTLMLTISLLITHRKYHFFSWAKEVIQEIKFAKRAEIESDKINKIHKKLFTEAENIEKQIIDWKHFSEWLALDEKRKNTYHYKVNCFSKDVWDSWVNLLNDYVINHQDDDLDIKIKEETQQELDLEQT